MVLMVFQKRDPFKYMLLFSQGISPIEMSLLPFLLCTVAALLEALVITNY